MASAKMLRRMRRAYDWTTIRAGARSVITGAYTDMSAEAVRMREEATLIKDLYLKAIAGTSDAELLAAGLADTIGYRNWREGSITRVIVRHDPDFMIATEG